MIYLGIPYAQKSELVRHYCQQHDVQKIVVFTPEKFGWEQVKGEEIVTYPNIIMYKYFYRLLQYIDKQTLVIVNECLRTQNRYDLTYNCLRHYLYQAGHQIIFQYLPMIASFDDVYILADWDTKSQWKKSAKPEILRHATFAGNAIHIEFRQYKIHASQRLQHKYAEEREKLFHEMEHSLKDPHVIPRALALLSGGEKSCHLLPNQWYLARNQRLKSEQIQTYRDANFLHPPYTVFEFCHNHIDFADMMYLSGQHTFDVLTTDLPVEQWYMNRYTDWGKELEHVYSTIHQ